MNGKVRTERDGSVLVIVIENPPLNAAPVGIRKGLLHAIATLHGDSLLEAAVLIGGERTFTAASDLRELGKPLEEPDLRP